MTTPIFHREDYLKKIRPFYRSDLIKVITGIRRAGKSCLMLSIIEELLQNGIPKKDIIHINLDKRGYKNITTPAQLESAIDSLVADDRLKYLFIDEVQNVKDFETVINAYREEGNFSIFITGSNSYLLSGELVTKLTGRYIEIELFTLSFPEYVSMKKFMDIPIGDTSAEFASYLRNGGFPKSLEYSGDDSARQLYLQNVISQILVKDVTPHNKIRHHSVFERLRTFVVNNFGSMISVSSLESHFRTRENLPIKRETVKKYLDILSNAKIVYRCPRFDMKSKQSISGEEKYYLADTGVYFASNTDGRINYGPALENVLFTYLKSKGYEVSVGRIGKFECDFIVRQNDKYAYVQVAMTIAEKSTEDREYRPFMHIRDAYPRYLFTLDPLPLQRDGVRHENIAEFLSRNQNLF